MRIIAGMLGGRLFTSPHGHRTHPMSDKVRGALFNALGDLGGLTVLDAFAGTGALSFEAISRGASSAVAIESDKLAQRAIAENIESLGLHEPVKLIRATTGAWLQTNPDVQFDVILCDPPYDNLQPALLTRLEARVKAGGLLVLSWPGSQAVPEFDGLDLIEQHGYGDAQLAFYRKSS